ADIVLGVMPSRHARALYSQMRPHIGSGAIVVSATKGLEQGTLRRMSEVVCEVMGEAWISVLSGPSFALEVAGGQPTVLVISSTQLEVATQVQRALSGPTLRLYTNTDPVGVELGGALKNVIAIAAGLCQGLGLGSNTLAALMTRGLA